jgi:hypothetical protein
VFQRRKDEGERIKRKGVIVVVARRNAVIVERRYGIRPKRSRRKAVID